MKEIAINNRDGVLTVSSLQISNDFGKRHADVLETIEKMKTENSVLMNMFIESSYKVSGNRKSYKCYELTRDGFSLLVMGFTGQKALEWKLKYIEAFNRMEQELRNGQPDLEVIISRAVSLAVAETVKTLVPLFIQNQIVGREFQICDVTANPRRRRRSHSIIAQLEPALQNEVDRMLLSDRFTYREVQELLTEHGICISLAAIGNYSQRLHKE